MKIELLKKNLITTTRKAIAIILSHTIKPQPKLKEQKQNVHLVYLMDCQQHSALFPPLTMLFLQCSLISKPASGHPQSTVGKQKSR